MACHLLCWLVSEPTDPIFLQMKDSFWLPALSSAHNIKSEVSEIFNYYK